MKSITMPSMGTHFPTFAHTSVVVGHAKKRRPDLNKFIRKTCPGPSHLGRGFGVQCMRAIRVMLACVCTSAILPVLAADPYPSQTVKLIVGFPAGGGTDVLARSLAVKLSERWKREVIVENRTGGSEVIAASAVASAAPDGYTLYMATDAALQLNQFLFTKLPYNASKSFSPILRVATSPLVMVVNSKSPYQTVGQLLDAATQSPGKITYASSGAGSPLQVAFEWLALKAGVQLTHVPYRGGAPAVQSVLAGDVNVTAVPLSVVESFIKSNMLRALAVTSPRRLTAMPSVPSLEELGYADMDVQVLNALVAPANTPKELIAKIAADAREIITTPEFSAQQVDRFGFVLVADTPAEFADYLIKDEARQRNRIRTLKLKLD